MEKIDFYNHNVHIFQCNNTEIYSSNKINESMDYLLNLPLRRPDEPAGTVLSSVGANFDMSGLPEFYNFYSWLVGQISSINHTFTSNVGNIEFSRTWVNRMFKHSTGNCHTHPDNIDGVAVFYTKIPDNSANLVLVHDDDQLIIPPKEGMLVIHNSDVPHAVSEHLSESPRECIISEFKIK